MRHISAISANVFRAQAKPNGARDLLLSPISLVVAALSVEVILFVLALIASTGISISDAIVYGASFTLLSLVVSGSVYKAAQFTDVSWKQLHRWRVKSLVITWIIDDLAGSRAVRTNRAIAESLLNNNIYWYELSWGDGREVFSSPLGPHDVYPWKDKLVYVVRLLNPARKGQVINHTTRTRLTDAFIDKDEWVSAYTLYSHPDPFKMCVVFPPGANIADQRLEYYRGGIRRTEPISLSTSNGRPSISVEIKDVTPRNMYYIKWSWVRESLDSSPISEPVSDD